jgi:hypothetical protein
MKKIEIIKIQRGRELSIVFNFALYLVGTILVEGVVILLKYEKMNYVFYSLLCNVLTNPMLNLLLYLLVWVLGSEIYIHALIILETIVVIVEAYVYKILCNFSKKEAIKLSILLNASSYLSGVIFFKFLTILR